MGRYKWKFRQIFRGDIKDVGVTVQDINKTLELLEMYKRVYDETKNLDVLLRQSTLTKEELLEYFDNPKKVINRIERIKKSNKMVRRLNTGEVRGLLERFKVDFIRLMYYEDSVKDVLDILWIPNYYRVIKEFIEELEDVGYLITDVSYLYNINEDVLNEYKNIKDICEKYTRYDESILRKNMKIHGIPIIEERELELISV